jgi:hypothetical protein
MIKFPNLNGVKEPRHQKMSPSEFISYCEFCLKNNPLITPDNCLDRKTGEESIKKPFSL